MTSPYPRPFTYEDCIVHCAESVAGDFSSVKGVALTSMAFALSLAFNRSVAEIHADLKDQLEK